MKRAIFFILLCSFLCGCGLRYSEEDVNATVSAKILEMAGRQKVYVTQETIIVKEYVLVTPTFDEIGAVIAEQQSTKAALPTSLPYDHMDAEQIAQILTKNGFQIRRFFFELSDEETNNMARLAESSTKFTLNLSGAEYEGRFFRFKTPQELEQALTILRAAPSTPAFPANHLITYENVLIELNGTVPEQTRHLIENALAGITEE